ncbi:MAG: lipopolysaccharide heptosyltransferase family protein [Sphingobacteriales bacterium]|nr:MAG: lipopolysaccharide heptosyltransferase family protein [Sphingobacteriales bacterium]
MKVLVVRFSSIGDIVLTTPVVRCLKKQLPDVEVHYVTKKSFRDVVASNPYIDKLHLLENDLHGLIEELKKEKFDYIIDLHNNLRTKRLKRNLDAKAYTFDKLNLRKWLLVNFKVNLMPDESIVERYLETVKPLGVKNDGLGLDYFTPKEAELQNFDVPMSHWAGYVGCVIGGSYNTKKLPVDKWVEFCNKVPYPIMLLGGPEDKADGDFIAQLDPIRIYNSCGKFSLNESAGLVEKSRIIISNDTGLMHIAASYGKKIISLWGNTSPDMGMFPYFGLNNVKNVMDGSHMLEIPRLYCHPCSKLGYNECPEGHFKCMNLLDMNLLAELVKKNWN